MKSYPTSFEKDATYGETLGPAMGITEQADADAYFEILVKYLMDCYDFSRERAERITRENLGYYCGYYDNATMVRVHRLFKCKHPVYGKAEEGKPVDPVAGAKHLT